jgi:hypothetical protein
MAKMEAWKKYRVAFDDYSVKAQRVQSLKERPGATPNLTEAALLEMERARLAYAIARDELARHLLPSLPVSPSVLEAGNVSGIAELLWEVAGRPQGTAYQDWLRAEEIVRRAAA